MKTAILLTVASLATVLGAGVNKPADEVKTDAAAGRYNRRPSYGGSYGGGYGYGQPVGYWQPLVQDRFVCDLDASVLLVLDSHHHHHNRHHGSQYYGNPSVPSNRAVRVKCSEVANHDIDSCNLCCQQTARRDTSLANDALFGFLAITKTDDDETFKRSKRGADDDDDDDDDESPEDHKHRGGKYHRVDSTYVSEADWSPPKYHTNVKCVCCAPRNNPAAQNPSTGYSNTAAQSPPAASTPYGNANTFTAVPAPLNTAPAAQPLMDSWQVDSGAAGANWNTGAASSNTGNQGSWNSGAASAPASGNQGSWNSGANTAASAPASGANWNAPADSNTGNQGSWNSGAASAPVTGNQGSWSGANTAAAPSGNQGSWNSGASTATSSDSTAWGAASDAGAAAPAPPPAAVVATAQGNKY